MINAFKQFLDNNERLDEINVLIENFLSKIKIHQASFEDVIDVDYKLFTLGLLYLYQAHLNGEIRNFDYIIKEISPYKNQLIEQRAEEIVNEICRKAPYFKRLLRYLGDYDFLGSDDVVPYFLHQYLFDSYSKKTTQPENEWPIHLKTVGKNIVEANKFFSISTLGGNIVINLSNDNNLQFHTSESKFHPDSKTSHSIADLALLLQIRIYEIDLPSNIKDLIQSALRDFFRNIENLSAIKKKKTARWIYGINIEINPVIKDGVTMYIVKFFTVQNFYSLDEEFIRKSVLIYPKGNVYHIKGLQMSRKKNEKLQREAEDRALIALMLEILSIYTVDGGAPGLGS